MRSAVTEETLVQVDVGPGRIYPGPILLLAGPGTGKTYQLALRVKDLVENRSVSPSSITVITFTKDAAENMRRRIADEEKKEVYVTPELRPERIMTMHSLGLEIVRSHTGALGLPEKFKVITDSRLRRVLFQDAAFLSGYGEKEAKEADRFRQEGVLPNAGTEAATITQRYEQILRVNSAIDYDDQILLACKLLTEDEALRKKYGECATHLLIDEYQDINAGQRLLISLLSEANRDGLFVVGDDDQSIYSFRGGNPRYIRDFQKEYGPDARVLKLVHSRRCPGQILKAALRVVDKFDSGRLQKPSPTFHEGRESAGTVKVHSVASDDAEAEIIASVAKQATRKKEVLILVPARQYAEPIKRELRQRRIVYDHPPFLDDSGFMVLKTAHDWHEEVSDNLALRLCVEDVCEGGQIGIPSRRSRKSENLEKRAAFLLEIAGLWDSVISNRITLWQALEAKASTSGGIFTSIHSALEFLRTTESGDPAEFLSRAAKNLQPWANVSELMKEVRGWLEELRTHGQAGEGRVKIMTLQAAKGLEADVVCVVGMNEEILPREGTAKTELEEAARLAYVSMTRAKEELHLFHARKRNAATTYLSQSFDLKPSRFLAAVDPDGKLAAYHQAPSKKSKGGKPALKARA